MALEITLWIVILAISLITFLFGVYYKVSFVFLIGCLLIALTGISLYAYDGLILERSLTSVADDGSFVYSESVIDSSNWLVGATSIFLVLIPLVSFFVIDFGSVKQRKVNLFHF